MRWFPNRTARAIGIAALVMAAALWFGATQGRIAAQPPPLPPPPRASGGITITEPDYRAMAKVIYEKHCAECHGTSGRGDGPASPLLTPRPRDFTTGKFKIRSTETGSLPTDDDLLRSVRQGLYGTAMTAWEKVLSDAEIRDVVHYIKEFSPRFRAEGELATSVMFAAAQLPSSSDSIARGQQVYDRLKCASCHGRDGRGTGAIATDLRDDWNQPLKASDLTEPWTFHGGATSRDVYLRFRTGMNGTPMPSFKDTATDGEMWDLANYVVSMGRKPVWAMSVDEITALYAQQAAEAKADPVKRGQYLVETQLCAICHSPLDANGRILPGMKLAGGQLIRVVPFGDFPTGNLTSDTATGLGNWTDVQIKNAITRGILRDGSRLLPYPMDWPGFAAMTPNDLNAMVAYLRSVPPVSNNVPRMSRPFLPVYLWGKFKMLILQNDPPIIIFPGNAGSAGGRS